MGGAGDRGGCGPLEVAPIFVGSLFWRAPEFGCAWVAAVAEIMVRSGHIPDRQLFVPGRDDQGTAGRQGICHRVPGGDPIHQ